MASLGWFFLSRRKSYRQVNRDGQGNRPVREVGHREDFGLVRVFQTISLKGDTDTGRPMTYGGEATGVAGLFAAGGVSVADRGEWV